MTRWALEDLADYVRGVAPAETRTAIDADLAGGGPAALQTRRDLELLAAVAAVARGDATAARADLPGSTGSDRLLPSRDSLIAVRAMFTAAAHELEPPLSLLPLLAVTDPHAGHPAGFRSAQLGHRDLEIQGERFSLDLSVDTPYDAIDVIVVGRITPAPSESWSVERVPAVLVGGGEVLATAVTNDFGEFHVATQTEEDDVELCLLISGVGQVRIPIDRRDPLFARR